MQIQEVMSKTAMVIDPNTTIRDVAAKLRAEDIGALPVGENDRLIGLVTDRDIVMRAVAEGKSPANTTARQVMSENVYYCFEDEDVEQAAKVMAERQVRRLPIVNRDKRLVGVVSLADLGTKAGDAGATALGGVSEATGQARR